MKQPWPTSRHRRLRVCVVGSGGREQALAWSCERAGAAVVVTPGNPGIPYARPDLDPETLDADLFIVGPERPLVAGLADRLRARGHIVFGPGVDGAQLEGSKRWMKELLARAGVPTARHAAFTDVAAAHRYLDGMSDLFIVKTDGLADGKGVLVTSDRREAKIAVTEYLAGRAFGAAGHTVVIEEGLTGPELSLLAICDGKAAVMLPAARDHKRVGDGDTGPNTGGMGTFSPVPGVPPDIEAFTMERAIGPTLHALRRIGIDYRGVLYAGLMLTPTGPKLLEYNVRLGDPEAQVILPRIASSVPDLLLQAAAGRLEQAPQIDQGAVVCVVGAAADYPTNPRYGDLISGLEVAQRMPGVLIFSAGIGKDALNRAVTAGGRVLNICGTGTDVADARACAYQAVEQISWPGITARRDIAASATTAHAVPHPTGT